MSEDPSWRVQVLWNSDYGCVHSTGIAHMRIRIRAGFAIICITYLVTISSILGGCGAPFNKNWQINPNPGSQSLRPSSPRH